jgi:hypothetical protein
VSRRRFHFPASLLPEAADRVSYKRFTRKVFPL